MLQVDAHYFLDTDTTQIPTGNLTPVAGECLDFLKPRKLDHLEGLCNNGIDHCFALNNTGIDNKKEAAWIAHEESGRILRVFTTQPGIQIYTGNNLDGTVSGHNNIIYHKHSAICLETQHYPDTPNRPEFPSTLLNPGEIYNHSAKFVFDIMQ